MHFVERKWFNVDQNFSKICSQEYDWYYIGRHFYFYLFYLYLIKCTCQKWDNKEVSFVLIDHRLFFKLILEAEGPFGHLTWKNTFYIFLFEQKSLNFETVGIN